MAAFLVIIVVAITAVLLMSGRSHSSGSTNGGLAPDFTLTDLNGQKIALADYRGGKAVILDFFATWCPNCRRDIPHEISFYGRYKDKVELIGVNLQEAPPAVAAFSAQFSIPFPVVLDPYSVAANMYNVRYTNLHVLIGLDGKIVRTVPGDIGESDFAELASS